MEKVELPKWSDYFLTLEAAMFPELPGMDCDGIIYAPGLVCTCCWTSLKLGFVVRNEMQQNIYGAECIQNKGVSQWRSLVRRARYYLLLDHVCKDEEMKPAQRKLLRELSLLVQVLPWSDFPRGMFLKRLKDQPLSDKQIDAVEKMVVEHGGLDGLLHQRDLMRRLTILYLSQFYENMGNHDSAKVESLLLQTYRTQLSRRQERLVYGLEETYKSARGQMSQAVLAQWPFRSGKMVWSQNRKENLNNGSRMAFE